MSYDIKLGRPSNYKIIEEDQIIEDDNVTVILNRPLNNTSNVIVRINDFRRSMDFKTEILLREDVSSQFLVSNDTIFVKYGPIFDGLKIGNITTYPEDVIVRIMVEDEDVSGQLTGIENYFIVEGKPILKSNNYDFNSLVEKDDIIVKINGTELSTSDIFDINAQTGRIQLNLIPESTDVVTISYYFRAKIKTLDSINGRIVLQEKPKVGQEVKVQYFSQQSDGWYLEKTNRSLFEEAYDVKFYQRKNTARVLVEKENVSSQFSGIERRFVTANSPLLPLYQDFTSTLEETLNNAATVFINGVKAPISGIIPETGEITLFDIPKADDLVQVTYYYASTLIPDRISVDYAVNKEYSEKATKHINLADYRIDNLGNYAKVRDEEKLIQDLRKIIVTVKGSDPVAQWYGTIFNIVIGAKTLQEYVKTRISGEIIDALTLLKNAQIQQEEYQTVTPNEFLDFIKNIEVEQSTTDPTYWKAVVDVITQAGTAFELEEPIVYPEDRLYGAGTIF